MNLPQAGELARDKRLTLYQRLAFISLCLTVLVLLLPGDLIVAMKQWLLAILPWDIRSTPSSDYPVDKIIHFGLFSLCAALLMRGWWLIGRPWWLLLIILAIVAVGTELLQQLIPGRGLEPADILLDMIGAVLGMIAARQYLLFSGRAPASRGH